jgi:hypothetical protein
MTTSGKFNLDTNTLDAKNFNFLFAFITYCLNIDKKNGN